MPLPHTRTRLKGYCTLKVSPGGVQLAEYHVDVTQDPAFRNLITIGAAQQLTIEQTRESHYRREFDNNLNGKPAETYPGLSSYKITLDRVDLYDASLIEAFGVNGVNIADQYKPLVLMVEQPAPVDDNGAPLAIDGRELKIRSYMIPGCWFNGLPLEFNIDDEDQKYVAHVEMVARDVIASVA